MTDASHPSAPMMIRNSRMMKTVLRLFLAIALYIYALVLEGVRMPGLELHARRLGDRREVLDLEEVALAEAEAAGEEVVREHPDLRVELAHAAVVEPAGRLDLVLGVDQVGLEAQEVLARLQLGVGLRHGEDALQRGLHVPLGHGCVGRPLGRQRLGAR